MATPRNENFNLDSRSTCRCSLNIRAHIKPVDVTDSLPQISEANNMVSRYLMIDTPESTPRRKGNNSTNNTNLNKKRSFNSDAISTETIQKKWEMTNDRAVKLLEISNKIIKGMKEGSRWDVDVLSDKGDRGAGAGSLHRKLTAATMSVVTPTNGMDPNSNLYPRKPSMTKSGSSLSRQRHGGQLSTPFEEGVVARKDMEEVQLDGSWEPHLVKDIVRDKLDKLRCATPRTLQAFQSRIHTIIQQRTVPPRPKSPLKLPSLYEERCSVIKQKKDTREHDEQCRKLMRNTLIPPSCSDLVLYQRTTMWNTFVIHIVSPFVLMLTMMHRKRQLRAVNKIWGWWGEWRAAYGLRRQRAARLIQKNMFRLRIDIRIKIRRRSALMLREVFTSLKRREMCRRSIHLLRHAILVMQKHIRGYLRCRDAKVRLLSEQVKLTSRAMAASLPTQQLNTPYGKLVFSLHQTPLTSEEVRNVVKTLYVTIHRDFDEAMSKHLLRVAIEESSNVAIRLTKPQPPRWQRLAPTDMIKLYIAKVREKETRYM